MLRWFPLNPTSLYESWLDVWVRRYIYTQFTIQSRVTFFWREYESVAVDLAHSYEPTGSVS